MCNNKGLNKKLDGKFGELKSYKNREVFNELKKELGNVADDFAYLWIGYNTEITSQELSETMVKENGDAYKDSSSFNRNPITLGHSLRKRSL